LGIEESLRSFVQRIPGWISSGDKVNSAGVMFAMTNGEIYDTFCTLQLKILRFTVTDRYSAASEPYNAHHFDSPRDFKKNYPMTLVFAGLTLLFLVQDLNFKLSDWFRAAEVRSSLNRSCKHGLPVLASRLS